MVSISKAEAEALTWTEVVWSGDGRENVMEGGQADTFTGFTSSVITPSIE